MVLKTEQIELAHGSGGRLTHELIERLFRTYFSNSYLDLLGDAAVLPEQRGRLALTTDSYVIRPIFFPGGDIGKLAVCGTVNDLSMVGSHPLYLTAGFILEEGLPYSDLERIVSSMAETADQGWREDRCRRHQRWWSGEAPIKSLSIPPVSAG